MTAPRRYARRIHQDGTVCRHPRYGRPTEAGNDPVGTKTPSVPLDCGPGGETRDHWWLTMTDGPRTAPGWTPGVDPLETDPETP